MPGTYYAIFRARNDARSAIAVQPPGTRVTWWEPTWRHVFPPHHKSIRFFIFWLLSRLFIIFRNDGYAFRNDRYSVLLVEDEQGRLVHRTCVLPAWFQFPFMQSVDVQLGDVYTPDELRRQGIALFGLRYCLERLSMGDGNIYYVAQPVNLPSHRLALKAGFDFFSLARKHPSKAVGYYSLVPGTHDYSLVTDLADQRSSRAQIHRLVRRRVLIAQQGQEGDVQSVAHDSSIWPRRPDKLRILAVIPVSAGPVAMIFAHRQMAAMAARGHSIEVFELAGRRNLRGLFGALGAYRKRLRSFRPDVVHAHYGAMTALFSVYGAKGLAPVVVTFRGSDLNPVPSMPRWQTAPSHALSKLAAWGAAHIVCVSAELRDRLWMGRRKAALIPTGVDTTKFYPSSWEAARQALGWDRQTPVVLFNAGQSPRVKRLDFAEEVVAIARKSIADIRFVVLDGTMEPDHVPTLMQASDCLLFTSDFEGSPTVIQEAMACNLPIVSVPVGDVPERLRDVIPSYVLPRDPAQLADAVVRVLRERPRSNGYEIAKREVGNEPILEALERVYSHVATAP